MKATKGFALRFTGDILTQMIRGGASLPKDSFLFKIAPSRGPIHCFEFLFKSEEGWEIPEGGDYPVITSKEDLPK